MSSPDPEVPDTRPGNYYVTVRYGERHRLLAGPFVNDHAGALGMVRQATILAIETDSKAHFYEFGTGRLPSDISPPGILNAWLVLPPVPPEPVKPRSRGRKAAAVIASYTHTQ